MPIYRCKCGAKYKIPDSAAGRHVRCKKCGHLFTVPKVEPEIVPLAMAPLEDSGTFAPQFQSSPDHPDSSPAPPVEPQAAKGYVPSVLWTFLFLSQPGNLITFFFLWFIFVMASYAPFAVVIITLLGFWFAAYKFSIILSGAAGEEDLPEIKYSGDLLDELIAPALKWFLSWAFVLFPLFVYSIVSAISAGLTNVFDIIDHSKDALFNAGVMDPVAITLLILGILLWPMVVLCVAIGGLGALVRIDFMLITIVKSIDGYVATLIILGAAIAVNLSIEKFLASAGGTSFSADAIISDAIKIGLNLYFDIVVLRIIGLYYRYFKNKFAWDWG